MRDRSIAAPEGIPSARLLDRHSSMRERSLEARDRKELAGAARERHVCETRASCGGVWVRESEAWRLDQSFLMLNSKISHLRRRVLFHRERQSPSFWFERSSPLPHPRTENERVVHSIFVRSEAVAVTRLHYIADLG
jgi:hypothetical protein